MILRPLTALALAVPFIALALPAAAQEFAGAYAGAKIALDRFDAEDLSYGDGSVDVDGTGIGLFAGYAWQSGPVVFGPEIFVTRHNADGNDDSYFLPFTAKTSYGLKARVGYDAGKILPYIAAGVMRTRVEADHSGAGQMASDTARGVSMAVGVDWAVTDRSFVRFEIERTNYSDDEFDWSGDIHEYELDSTAISIGFAMRF